MTIDPILRVEVKGTIQRVISSVSAFFLSIHPSAPNCPIKNLMIPCSVTLPLVTYLSLIFGSFPSFYSSQAEAFQRTLSTIVSHPSYPETLISRA
jgi:hypothetical protein